MMHRKPWLTLRFRLVAWYLLLAGVSTFVFDGFVYYDFRQLLLTQVDASLKVASIQALKNVDDEVDQLEFDARPDSTLLASLLNQAGLEIYLRGRDGSLKAGFGQSLVLAAEPDVRLGFQTVVTPDGRWRTLTQEIGSRNRRPPGWLTVARSLEPVDATLTDVFSRHLLKLPFLLGIVGCCGLFLASRALKPIGQIAQAARQVRISGDLSQRVHYQGSVNDELARLATMFDEMLASLQTNFAQQSQLIADASHELRTPLTTLNPRRQESCRPCF